MTETSDSADNELADRLAELDEASVAGEGADLRAQVDEQLAKWRAWIDELVVQADLGRMDLRGGFEEVVQRLENSYLALKNQAERAVERSQGRGEQVQRGVADAADDLREGVVKATGDLRSAAKSALDQLRKSS